MNGTPQKVFPSHILSVARDRLRGVGDLRRWVLLKNSMTKVSDQTRDDITKYGSEQTQPPTPQTTDESAYLHHPSSASKEMDSESEFEAFVFPDIDIFSELEEEESEPEPSPLEEDFSRSIPDSETQWFNNLFDELSLDSKEDVVADNNSMERDDEDEEFNLISDISSQEDIFRRSTSIDRSLDISCISIPSPSFMSLYQTPVQRPNEPFYPSETIYEPSLPTTSSIEIDNSVSDCDSESLKTPTSSSDDLVVNFLPFDPWEEKYVN